MTENEYAPYQQIDPVAGSSKTGTVKPDGEAVTFRNLIPSGGSGGDPDSGTLEVRWLK